MKHKNDDACIVDLCDRFYQSGSVDYVGLWEIYIAAKSRQTKFDDALCKDITISIVNCLLKKGMKPFIFSPSSNEKIMWDCKSDDDAIERIKVLWADLRDEPSLGDICWFMRL